MCSAKPTGTPPSKTPIQAPWFQVAIGLCTLILAAYSAAVNMKKPLTPTPETLIFTEILNPNAPGHLVPSPAPPRPVYHPIYYRYPAVTPPGSPVMSGAIRRGEWMYAPAPRQRVAHYNAGDLNYMEVAAALPCTYVLVMDRRGSGVFIVVHAQSDQWDCFIQRCGSGKFKVFVGSEKPLRYEEDQVYLYGWVLKHLADQHLPTYIADIAPFLGPKGPEESIRVLEAMNGNDPHSKVKQEVIDEKLSVVITLNAPIREDALGAKVIWESFPDKLVNDM